MSNAFTKELAAKLGTVVKNQDSDLLKTNENRIAPPHATPPPENKEKKSSSKLPATGLFGEEDDDDLLFGGVSKASTVAIVRTKTSGLFDDAQDDLFSGTQPKVEVPKAENKPEGSGNKNPGKSLREV